jgi:hypothetical protein
MNNEQLIGGIYGNLQKASDCVGHVILIKKLKFYAIICEFGALIKSYLEGRYQRVNLDTYVHKEFFIQMDRNNICSTPRINSWPTFSLLYINDIIKVSIKEPKSVYILMIEV